MRALTEHARTNPGGAGGAYSRSNTSSTSTVAPGETVAKPTISTAGELVMSLDAGLGPPLFSEFKQTAKRRGGQWTEPSDGGRGYTPHRGMHLSPVRSTWACNQGQALLFRSSLSWQATTDSLHHSSQLTTHHHAKGTTRPERFDLCTEKGTLRTKPTG